MQKPDALLKQSLSGARVAPWKRSLKPLQTGELTAQVKGVEVLSKLTGSQCSLSTLRKPKHLDLQKLRVQRALRRKNVSNSSSPDRNVMRKVSGVESLWRDMNQHLALGAHSRSVDHSAFLSDELLKLTQHANVLLETIKEDPRGGELDRSLPQRKQLVLKTVVSDSASEELLNLIKNREKKSLRKKAAK